MIPHLPHQFLPIGAHGIRRKSAAHFQHGNAPAHHAVVDGGFASYLSAADDHHVLSHLFRSGEAVSRPQNVFPLHTGNGGNQWHGSDSADHAVKPHALQLFRGDAAVQAQGDSLRAPHMLDEIVLVIAQIILETHEVRVIELAAQHAARLKERYGMSAFRRQQRMPPGPPPITATFFFSQRRGISMSSCVSLPASGLTEHE